MENGVMFEFTTELHLKLIFIMKKCKSCNTCISCSS